MISRIDVIRILQHASLVDLYDIDSTTFRLKCDDLDLVIAVEEQTRCVDDDYVVISEDELKEIEEQAEETLYVPENEWMDTTDDKVRNW